jgi:hypothetical protein
MVNVRAPTVTTDPTDVAGIEHSSACPLPRSTACAVFRHASMGGLGDSQNHLVNVLELAVTMGARVRPKVRRAQADDIAAVDTRRVSLGVVEPSCFSLVSALHGLPRALSSSG